MWVPVAAENGDLSLQGEFWCREEPSCVLSPAQRSYLGMLDMIHEILAQAVGAMPPETPDRELSRAEAPTSPGPFAALQMAYSGGRYVLDERGADGRVAQFGMHSQAAAWGRCGAAGHRLVWCDRHCGR